MSARPAADEALIELAIEQAPESKQIVITDQVKARVAATMRAAALRRMTVEYKRHNDALVEKLEAEIKAMPARATNGRRTV